MMRLAFFVTSLLVGIQGSKPKEILEVCEREEFSAECGNDEVILMRMAEYGRMRASRCVSGLYGGIGCSANVLPVVHTFCSGKRKCSFPITDLHKPSSGCPTELISYMQASYDCIKVAQCQKNLCQAGDFLKVSASSNYLASTVTSETRCGSATCPWMLEPQPGQSLNLTFHSFMDHDPMTHVEPNLCMVLATVVEKNSELSRDVNFCGDTTVMSLTTAVSSPVEIRMRVPLIGSHDDQIRFVMKYEVIGCPDPPVPTGGWVTREDNATAHIGCGKGPAQWKLNCVGGNWVGKVGTCSEDGSDAGWGAGLEGEQNGSTGGLLVVIGAGVALGVVLGFVMLSLAILYMKRKQRHTDYRRREVLMMPSEFGDDRSQVPSKYFESSHGGDKTPDALSYSTYSTRNIHDSRLQAPGKAFPVQIPETPSMYYGQDGGRFQAGTLSRDHMYEYPAFVGPVTGGHKVGHERSTDPAAI